MGPCAPPRMNFNVLPEFFAILCLNSSFLETVRAHVKCTFTLLQLTTDGGCSQYKTTSPAPLLADLAFEPLPPAHPFWGGSSGAEREEALSVASQKLCKFANFPNPLGEEVELQRAAFSADKMLLLISSQLLLNRFPV